MRIGFVINSRRNGQGNRKRAEQLLQELKVEGEVLMTIRSGHAIELAWKLTEKGCDTIVAVGGDGTVNEVVNGIMRGAGSPTASELPALAIVAAGTGNDFVRPIETTGTWEQLKAAILNPKRVTVDVGTVNYTSLMGIAANRWFINIGEVGMGGAVVERLNRWRTKAYMPASYNLSILATFAAFKHLPVNIEADDWQWSGRVMAVLAANGSYFGRGLGIAPGARMSDGIFEVVIIGEISALDYLKQLSKIRKGIPLTHPEIHYKQAKTLRVLPATVTALGEADGEMLGKGPFEFQLLPGRLDLLTVR